MAFMTQEMKKEIAKEIKPILKKYNVKATLGVRHHSTLELNVYSSPIDFIGNYNANAKDHRYITRNNIQVNVYWYKEHFTGAALDFLNEVMPLLNKGNFDKSDIMTDYFHVGWYVNVNIGKYNRDYVVAA